VAVTLGIGAAAFNLVVPVPNVEATTLVVVSLALRLGAAEAVLAGTIAVVGTGVAGGIGVWTAWQVVGFGIIALAVSAITTATTRGKARSPGPRRPFLLACVAGGTVFYDLLLTASGTWLLVDGAAWGSAVRAALLLGAPFTFTHLAANLALAWLAGASLGQALERARARAATVPGRGSASHVQHRNVARGV